jgi:hypothetical protein
MADGFDPDAYLKKKSTSESFDPDAYLAGKSKPKKSNFEKVTQAVDSVTGAPSRAAVSKLLDGEILGAGSAFVDNFAGDSTKAPTAKDLALKIGVNDNKADLEKAVNDPLSLKGLATRTIGQMIGGAGLAELVKQQGAKFLDKQGVTNADLAALPIDVATDWTNLIPAVGALKKVVKGAGKADDVNDGLRFLLGNGKLEKIVDAAKVADKADDISSSAKVLTGDDAAQMIGKSTKMTGELGVPAKDAIALANEGGVKANAKAIEEAATALGFKPTPAMLSNNLTMQALESSLDQSASIGGLAVRSGKTGTNQLRQGLKQAASKFGDEASSMSKVDLGDAIKADILEKVNLRYEPVGKSFDSIRESTQFMEVPEKSKQILARNFLRQKDVALSPTSSWGQKAARYANDLENVKSVDDIKRLRSLALNEARASMEPNEQRVLNYIGDRLQALEGVTIKRAASATAPTPKQGVKVGNDLVKQLRNTRKDFKGIIQPLGEVAKESGLSRPKTIKDFARVISETPSEKLPDMLFRINNTRALNLLKKEFPTSFDLIRNQRIGEIIEKSSVKGEILPSKLLKNLKAIGPEARELIFNSKDVNQSVNYLETVLNAIPNKIGPSGTPQGQMLMNILNIPFQATEIGRAGLYKTVQNPTQPISKVIKFGQQAPSRFKKAGQISSQALPDLLGVAKSSQLGVGASRGLSDLIRERKK